MLNASLNITHVYYSLAVQHPENIHIITLFAFFSSHLLDDEMMKIADKYQKSLNKKHKLTYFIDSVYHSSVISRHV